MTTDSYNSDASADPTGRSREIALEKQQLRRLMRQQLRSRSAPQERSRRIIDHLYTLIEWSRARSLLWFVNMPGEVETYSALERELTGERRCAVTWCQQDKLELCWLEGLNELKPQTLGILEPIPAIREKSSRKLDIQEIDAVLVPGLAFDRAGHRLGRGKGYYDRLLANASPRAALIALAFSEQIVDEIPVESHDIAVHFIITEQGIHPVATGGSSPREV